MKAEMETLFRSPRETDLIVHTERPPQMETPLRHFQSNLTPNDAFFVRWHVAELPGAVDLQSFRLQVGGHVGRPLSL
ncbi:MAG TPA: hypothetical protein VKV05_00195, partial [Terriglobales bacterium]|nr:hypothetical protein [Terriglobales bacterium]